MNSLVSVNAIKDMEPLLTIRDLATLLRVHPRTIRRLCQAGRLPQPIKLGGSHRWRIEDIDRTLGSGYANASARSC